MPTIGLRTPSAKFQDPVKKAKMVPSIPGGVILANKAKHGSTFKASDKHPKTTSVNMMNTKSLIPNCTFHLIAKQ